MVVVALRGLWITRCKKPLRSWRFPTVEIRCRSLNEQGSLSDHGACLPPYASLPPDDDLLSFFEERQDDEEWSLVRVHGGGEYSVAAVPMVGHCPLHPILALTREVLHEMAALCVLCEGDLDTMEFYVATVLPFGSPVGDTNPSAWLASHGLSRSSRNKTFGAGIVVTHIERISSAQYGREDVQDVHELEGSINVSVDNPLPVPEENDFCIQLALSYVATAIQAFELHPTVTEATKSDIDVELPAKRSNLYAITATAPGMTPNRSLMVLCRHTHGLRDGIVRYRANLSGQPPFSGTYRVSRSRTETNTTLDISLSITCHVALGQGLDMDDCQIHLQYGRKILSHTLAATQGAVKVQTQQDALIWSLVPTLKPTPPELLLTGQVLLAVEEELSDDILNCAAVMQFTIRHSGTLTGSVLVPKSCTAPIGSLKVGPVEVIAKHYTFWNQLGQSVNFLPQVVPGYDIFTL